MRTTRAWLLIGIALAITAGGCGSAGGNREKESPGESTPMGQTFTGTLRSGIMAIGGETTGIILETESGRYELDAPADRELRARLEGLDGRRVIVTGEYRPRPGVEVKERRIILVRSVREAP